MKIKKLLSILLAAVLMIGCIGISASAADETVTVSLSGEKQAIISEEYEVMINVAETTADLVGGISCDVNYDTTKFTFKRIEIDSNFAAANGLNDANTHNKIVNVKDGGVISVVLLDVPEDAAQSNWLTIVFDVNNGQSAGTTSFELTNVKVADATGAKLFTIDEFPVDVTKNVYAHMLDVNGASIRKDGVGNIRFEAEIDSTVDRSQIEEIGFLMIPAVCLKDGLYNGDLTFTDSGVYTTAIGKTATIVSNCKKISEIDSDTNKVYCYLTNTTSFNLSTSFAARAYIKLTDETIIYSDNQVYVSDSTYEKNIKGGTSSKSCIETAKAIYNIYKDNENVTFSDEFKNIIVKDSWDNTEYKTIVAELANVSDSFN